MARRQLETAKQIVAALGTMKGAAMKLGQVMSFLDVGLVAEEHREEFQRELAKLRDAAPTVSFKQMRRVIEDDLEEPISEVFASFEQEPIAAASIGQVYRATLHDGPRGRRQGPVPGGRRRGARGHAEPGHDHAPAQADDAGHGREGDRDGDPRTDRRGARLRAGGPEPARARAHIRGHPFIVVPEVLTSLSRERVLVSEFVRRRRVRGAQGPSPGRARPDRGDRVPLLSRLPVSPPAVLRRSPPGQLPAAGGRARRVPGLRPVQAHGARAGRARDRLPAGGVEGDAATLHRLLAASGFLPEPDRVDPEHLLAFIGRRSGGTRPRTNRSS